MSAIFKVDEKVKYVISLLPDSYTDEQFKTIYPEDYEKCMAKFAVRPRLFVMPV